MPLKLNNSKLFELMENFYILTGMRIVIFDEKYKEVLAYPENPSPFCCAMRKNENFLCLCNKSDELSFENCKKTKSLIITRCHAGLIEATAPLLDNNTIIGYLMFGQITDNKDKDSFIEQFVSEYSEYDCFDNALAAIKKIKYKKTKQIYAAAKILDACTSYIQIKEMAKPSKMELVHKIENFIETHINESISIKRLCDEFNISRTSLYTIMGNHTEHGIAQLIKEKRLQYSKKLLKTTNYSIAEISEKIGFSDYNYFLRAFKKRFGISPRNYKNTQPN